ncbi:MAG: DUF362 domain-containing protein [Candidatus Latescibacteria bacterium]|nr:DUF362 domain-containing protein [Candidatus Latescibacterota bacterium]
MKRRDFIKSSTAAGFSGILAQACSTAHQNARRTTGPGFDLHPFVKAHPEAVFITHTSVASKRDIDDIHSAGAKLAKELIVKSPSGGFPNSTKITVKPNWTCASPQDGHAVYEKLGVNTDPNFIAGWVNGMREAGPRDYYIRECACPQSWADMGWVEMTEKNNIDFRDLSSMDYWELEKGDLYFIKTPKGVVFKEIGFMSPMNEPDTFLVNIAKMKAHGMGITATIKNLQGISGHRFHQMCTGHDQIRKRFGIRYDKFFQKNFEKRIEELHAQHVADGYPRWDRPDPNGGLRMETWVQRMLDSLSVTPTALNMVEGIYSQDGNGFGTGPHEKLGPYEVSSRDYMSNIIIFGANPFRVDIITHWLAGHEPGNFGLFHSGIERGMSDVLDPFDIPVYNWKDGQAELARLIDFKRTPLVTYYLPRDYNGGTEDHFHLCDEPFDYSAWKKGARVGDCTPSIKDIGRDSQNRVVMELSLPKKEWVYVDVLDRDGEIVTRLITDELEPGNHQVVWDGFASPGLYSAYVKGMGWDAVHEIVTYS